MDISQGKMTCMAFEKFPLATILKYFLHFSTIPAC